MADNTKIEWSDATWSPLVGCTHISTGCDHCYAASLASGRLASTPTYEGLAENGKFNGTVRLLPDRLDQPLRWKRPRMIFVNSMSDLFHESAPDSYIAQVFAVMARAPQHTFQVLTKRHGRMRSLLNSHDFHAEVWQWLNGPEVSVPWPLPNVWLGVSAEDQKWADIRIPALLSTPAAVRFVSAEPLLGRITLADSWLMPQMSKSLTDGVLDWVIVGGESGHGARPMHPDWARAIRDDCVAAEVAFLFKQRGEWTWSEPGEFRLPGKPHSDRVAVMHPAGMTALTKANPFDPFERGHPNWTTRIERIGKKAAGRELDGRTWDEYP